MFDFDAGKLLIIGVVALIVIGPKDLPRVLRQVGQAVGRLRRMAGEFQGQFMDAMKEADLQNIRDEVTRLGTDAKLDVRFDPLRDIQGELTKAVSAPVSVASDSPALGTSEFSLPELPHEGGPTETQTLASSGLAPTASDAAQAELETELNAAKKRKIVLARRRPAMPPAALSDGRSAPGRFRNVRQRRREVTEQ